MTPQIQTYQVILPLNSRRSAPDLETAKPPAIVYLYVDQARTTYRSIDSELADGLQWITKVYYMVGIEEVRRLK